MTENIENMYKEATEIINNAGEFSYPFTKTLIEIIKFNVKKEHLEFIMAFKNGVSQSVEQLKESSGLSYDEIIQKADELAKRGVVFNQPNRQGLLIIRLLPVYRQFEYTFMKNLDDSEDFQTLALLYEQLDKEVEESIQNDYDSVIAAIDKRPPIDRTILSSSINKNTGDEIDITVNHELEVPTEEIIQDVEKIIDKYDEIAVGNCFCRQFKDLLGESCKHTDLRENCFTLGKSARHTSQQGFSRMISKDEAKEILRKSKDDGLVHKAYHLHSDIHKEEVAICNCCSCCCPNSRNVSIGPVVNANNYLAQINEDLCTGCGTCVEKCYNSAIMINDDNIAERDENFCIGCGVCSYFCPENAISMVEGLRMVRMMPARGKS